MHRGVNVPCNPLKPCFYIWQVNIFMQLGKIGDTQKPTNKQTQHIFKCRISEIQKEMPLKRVIAVSWGNQLESGTALIDFFSALFFAAKCARRLERAATDSPSPLSCLRHTLPLPYHTSYFALNLPNHVWPLQSHTSYYLLYFNMSYHTSY